MEDEDGILDDIPFTAQELEGEYDEEVFMNKLDSYFQSKYGEESVIEDENEERPSSDTVDIHAVSAVDIFTMNEDDLDRVFPLNDNESSPPESKSDEKPKGKQSTKRRRKRNRKQNGYRKVPTASKSKSDEMTAANRKNKKRKKEQNQNTSPILAPSSKSQKL